MEMTLVTLHNDKGKSTGAIKAPHSSVHMQSDWLRIKDDPLNLALQELPDRGEKGSLSLSGLQLAFGFVKVPDNVSSNLLQLLSVTQARPLLCHELSLLSSEPNPPEILPPQNNTGRCCYFVSTVIDHVKHALGNMNRPRCVSVCSFHIRFHRFQLKNNKSYDALFHRKSALCFFLREYSRSRFNRALSRWCSLGDNHLTSTLNQK